MRGLALVAGLVGTKCPVPQNPSRHRNGVTVLGDVWIMIFRGGCPEALSRLAGDDSMGVSGARSSFRVWGVSVPAFRITFLYRLQAARKLGGEDVLHAWPSTGKAVSNVCLFMYIKNRIDPCLKVLEWAAADVGLRYLGRFNRTQPFRHASPTFTSLSALIPPFPSPCPCPPPRFHPSAYPFA